LQSDIFQVDFEYISRRLTKEMVQNNRSRQGPRERSVSFKVGPVSVESRRKELNYDNPFEIARQATKAVERSTTPLEGNGKYRRGVHDLQLGKFVIHAGGNSRGTKLEAAIMISDKEKTDSGIFIVMVGSITNYVAHQGRQEQGGWSPSHFYGLYQLLSQSLEPEDSGIEESYITEEILKYSDDSAIYQVAALADTSQQIFPTEQMEFLVRVHRDLPNYSLDGRTYARILLCAPVWIAKASS
jgi:hypothetical protein